MMKITQFTFIAALLSLALVSMTKAAPFEDMKKLVKRENKPIYLSFNEIANKLTEFGSSQNADSPDFNHLAFDLNVLSTDADSAFQALYENRRFRFKSEEITSISQNLKSISGDSVAVEQMAIKGNQWYNDQNVVSKIVQILQLDAFQFYALFAELNKHMTKTNYSNIASDLSVTVCHYVKAIQNIDSNALSTGTKSPVTYCNNLESGKAGNFDTDGFDIAFVKPAGMESCGNSASRFLYAAYRDGTLGTSKTKCTDNGQLIESSLPSNALGLK